MLIPFIIILLIVVIMVCVGLIEIVFKASWNSLSLLRQWRTDVMFSETWPCVRQIRIKVGICAVFSILSLVALERVRVRLAQLAITEVDWRLTWPIEVILYVRLLFSWIIMPFINIRESIWAAIFPFLELLIQGVRREIMFHKRTPFVSKWIV